MKVIDMKEYLSNTRVLLKHCTHVIAQTGPAGPARKEPVLRAT